ncbi:hypothetical protein H0R96_09525 [Treponema socranskii]
MWTWHTDTGLRDGQYSKHIYLGETRVVTKQTSKLEASYGQSDEWHHQYYYHPDHLGSAQLITDYEGNEYQRIEYTPYGELWVEKKTAKEEGLRYLPYKFTAKEQDEETGLYYYGARYLDAKYSRWLSADPAVGDYIPQAPVNDEAKKHNEQLLGIGGVFNVVDFQLYHYAGNNPVKYIDSDGKSLKGALRGLLNMGLSALEIKGRITMMTVAAAGQIGSVCLATPFAIVLGCAGFAVMVDGFVNFALSASTFAIEIGDCFTKEKNLPDANLLPSNFGGMIGSTIDQSNGFNAQTEGKKGKVQIKGEKINTVIAFGLNLIGYVQSLIENGTKNGLSVSDAGEIISNEMLHQYDVYNTTKTVIEE